MLIHFRVKHSLGTIEVDDPTSNSDIRMMIAEQLSVDPATVEISQHPFPEPLLPATVDAKYGEVYSKVVSLENSDLWPAKLQAAHAVIHNTRTTDDPDYRNAYQRLALLLHPDDILAAGSQADAVLQLAHKIHRKSAETSLLLFELDGLRRTFYQDMEKLNLDVIDDTVQQLIRSTIAKMDKVA